MFGLFGKKQTKEPEEQVRDCQTKQDWAGLVRAYYQLGREAMDRGNQNQAQLWLHRADTIYSARDEIYDAVGEKLMDDCSDRIGQLEEESLLYNDVPDQIEEKAEALEDPQVRIWGLLSMARMVKLGERLSALPGCEVLRQLGWAVDMMCSSMQEPPSQEDFQALMQLCNQFYELNGKEIYWCGEIAVPGKTSFQVFDLNGMMGVDQAVNSYMDNHLRFIAAMSQGREELPAGECDMVGCVLLPDYYVRTGAAALEEVPQIKAELARIWSDFEFVSSNITWEQVESRLAEYKNLDILQG